MDHALAAPESLESRELRVSIARNAREEEIVESKQARQNSMRVRVKRTYSMPELKGQVGTINPRYGGVHYPAFKVCFEDGRSELFWSHELEEA